MKKNYRLEVELVERVRRLVRARTDTEAIHRALREAVENREIEQSLERLLRAGRFRMTYW